LERLRPYLDHVYKHDPGNAELPDVTVDMKYLSTPEVAAVLEITVPTVNKMLQDGRLPGVKLGPAGMSAEISSMRFRIPTPNQSWGRDVRDRPSLDTVRCGEPS
jgi:excisionase family DNA binding protein